MFRELNWIDWIIVAVTAYYAITGWQSGLVRLLANLAGFLGSLWLAIKYHSLVGNFLVSKFGLPNLWTDIAGYLIIAFVSEIIISELFGLILARLPEKILESKANQWLGALVSVVNGLVVVAFILLLILALPLRGNIKQDIKNARIGSMLVKFAEKYGGKVTSSLDEVSAKAVKFLTVEPRSNERVALDVTPNPGDLSPDPVSEQIMVTLVNNARSQAGVGQVKVSGPMITVARSHSRDMFMRRYFGHLDPDGHDAAYRMEQAGIGFTVVGENLAYAPEVNIAHTGLMNSPGHRQNILDPEFHRIGIGIISAGIYGETFTQLFAD